MGACLECRKAVNALYHRHATTITAVASQNRRTAAQLSIDYDKLLAQQEGDDQWSDGELGKVLKVFFRE